MKFMEQSMSGPYDKDIQNTANAVKFDSAHVIHINVKVPSLGVKVPAEGFVLEIRWRLRIGDAEPSSNF